MLGQREGGQGSECQPVGRAEGDRWAAWLVPGKLRAAAGGRTLAAPSAWGALRGEQVQRARVMRECRG